jgi:hypothetical protein
VRVGGDSASPGEPGGSAGAEPHAQSLHPARTLESPHDDPGADNRRPAHVRTLAIIDSHRLSAECLTLLMRECDPEIAVMQYEDALDCVDAVGRGFDAILHTVHAALTSTSVAVHEVSQLADAYPDAFLMTLSDAEDLHHSGIVLRLRAAGSACVASTRTTRLEDVMVALGLGEDCAQATATRYATSNASHN